MQVQKLNTTVKDRISADLQEAGIDISDSTFSIKIGADGQVSVDGIQDHAMKSEDRECSVKVFG